jgi:hypothetical protein
MKSVSRALSRPASAWAVCKSPNLPNKYEPAATPSLEPRLQRFSRERRVRRTLRAKGDRNRIATALRTGPPFPTILGNALFPKNGIIQPAFHIVLAPDLARQDHDAVLEGLRRVAKDDKEPCNKCKNTHECPQGSIAASVKKEDCCKKTDECPQGFLFVH